MILSLTLLLSTFFSFGVSDSYCPTAPKNPTDRREDKTRFRLVQFNAEWLFVDGFDNCPGTTCPWKDDTMAAEHVSAIASVIADLNPDFINLCEVESCNELNDLLNDPNLSGKGYLPYMIQGTDSATGQDVGMLTKIDPQEDLQRTESRVAYPIPETTCTSSYTGTYGCSKHYITSINVNGMKIAIFSVHLLAYPDDQNRCVEREAQAVVIQQAIQPYIDQGYEVIVLGDFNDFDDQTIDANNNIPISQVNSILKGQGTNWKLTNAAELLKQSERYSIWWDSNEDCVYNKNETSMLDHIMLSDGLLEKVTNVYIAHDEYKQSCDDFYYSDHWPVVVDFQF